MEEARTLSTVRATATTTALHKHGAFDMDDNAALRSLAVIGVLLIIIAIWIVFKMYRRRTSERRIRRYDLLSARQLVPELAVDSEDSDDELFEASFIEQPTARLVAERFQ